MLDLLFDQVADAVDCGQLHEALRLADRARRLAPDDPLLGLLHAQLLTLTGSASLAVARLDKHSDPDSIIALSSAYCEQGRWKDASDRTADLLRRFSVDSHEALAPLALSIARNLRNDGVAGWIGLNHECKLVGEIARNSGTICLRLEDADLECEVQQGRHSGFDSLVCAPPRHVSGTITAYSDAGALLGSGMTWPPDFDLFAYVSLEEKALVGEARFSWARKLPVTLAIGRSGETQHRLCPVKQHPTDRSFLPISLNRWELAFDAIEVSAILPDGSHAPVPGSPICLQQRCPEVLGDRSDRSARHGLTVGERYQPSSEKIDIVIPVHSGYEETVSCIAGVMATVGSAEAEIVVVDDASVDARLRSHLAQLAKDGHITLLLTPRNLGFPGAANLGIRLHHDRDVVLLNADTEVCGDWLARLKAVAFAHADTGTVTPLSEAGSLTDYSRERAGAVPTVEEIDAIARRSNAGQSVELPVGIGMCLYIKRECIAETGHLDETTFAKGYGEENDFCLRARRLGWRHMAATDVFIGHLGGRSYGRTKAMLQQRNGRLLNLLHPGYDELIARFIAQDPLLRARRAIDIERLVHGVDRPVLLVTCSLPGGVKRHVKMRQEELTVLGHTVLVLQPGDPSGTKNRVVIREEALELRNLVFDSASELAMLQDVLKRLNLCHVEVHHFLGLQGPVLEAVAALRVPYSIHIHDYSWICPRVTLIGGDGEYCGEPSPVVCRACVKANGSAMEKSLTVVKLRARSASILERAKKIIAPTDDVRRRMARYYPWADISVEPWEQVEAPAVGALRKPHDRVRVAVIGAIGLQKGLAVLLRCARDAAERDLNLEFIVIGYTSDDDSLLATGRVFVTGPYEEEEVEYLLEREGCNLAFFPSVSPETWCYSLTHALRRGLPVVAFAHGAVAERLGNRSGVRLIPLRQSSSQINDSLLELAESSIRTESPTETNMNETHPSANDDQTPSQTTAGPELMSSVQIVTLPPGIYSFTIKAGATSIDNAEGLTLPALQIGIAPSRSVGKVEFLTGASALDRWLAFPPDMIVVKIAGGDAGLLLTSVRTADSPVLAVEAKRLGAEVDMTADSHRPLPAHAGGMLPASLPVKLLAHIKNVGDLQFMDSLAGWPGQKLWIEAFAVSLNHLPNDAIEYCGIGANGNQSPWLSNQMLCGSRGVGMPMIGYAVRLKPELAARYDCIYKGRFLSGAAVGPIQDGSLCCSELSGDPLETMEVRVTAREMVQDAERRPAQSALHVTMHPQSLNA